MKQYLSLITFLLFSSIGIAQPFDTAKYSLTIELSNTLDQYFSKDAVWRGADGAASIDLGNGKVVWLFSDSFICNDPSLKKYLQIQSFGFGEGKLGIRMADRLQGKWTEPYLFFTPEYPGVKQPFLYSAKAHPELRRDGLYITYNVNSFDFGTLIENESIYFPKFVLVKNVEKKGQ